MIKNKKFWIILYFIALIIIGSLGYYIIGGSKWTFLDSLYMTIITLASVGYGEVHALDNSGKIWSILLIIFGVTGVGALFRTINEEFIQSQLFWKNKMKKTIGTLKDFKEKDCFSELCLQEMSVPHFVFVSSRPILAIILPIL